MEVSVLAFKNCTALASIGPMAILFEAGRLPGGNGGSPFDSFFKVQLVSVGENPVISSNGYPVQCHTTADKVEKTDLVLVPTLEGDVLAQMALNRAAIPFVQRMHNRGADVASICTGAFILAEAGLLDGRSATTHWMAQELFARRYPRVQLLPEQIVVDHGRICTSGGATAFLTLSMYLVEKYCSAEMARLASKVFLIDMAKGPQTSYAIFSTQKNHGDSAILNAQLLMEQKSSQAFSVAELAEAANMSRRNFIRRFKAATGNTPIEYFQRVHIEEAKRALESGNEPVDSIAGRVGYGDLGSFRRVFKRLTGVTPSEYRKRYRFAFAERPDIALASPGPTRSRSTA